MSAQATRYEQEADTNLNSTALRDENVFQRVLRTRHLRGSVWKRFFMLAIIVAVLALFALAYNIVNGAFGFVIEDYAVRPAVLQEDGNLAALSNAELAEILLTYQESRLPVYIRDYLYTGDNAVFTQVPMAEMLPGANLPVGTYELTVRDLTALQQAEVLADNLSQTTLIAIVEEQVMQETILRTFTLVDSIFNRAGIETIKAEEFPDAVLYFRSWVSIDFITSPMSSNPAIAGIRTALLGSIWVLGLTVVVAFPLGVGAAIYLEEFASDGWINRLIETNIRNLAGVPAIIYGLVGLAIFVRLLSGFTGGRTIMAAGLTMTLVILPVIIINAQEALRAVPSPMREASFGMGATRWQTVSRVVLPAAVPGILTGTILAMSRAIGETSPLIIIGASTYILTDPTGLQSKFTVLPIIIYNWTARPKQEFHDAASAAIIVLLVLLVTFNVTAIVLRQRARRRLSAA
jgi:phosphate transport system permease protein